jgi:hypothetical protein
MASGLLIRSLSKVGFLRCWPSTPSPFSLDAVAGPHVGMYTSTGPHWLDEVVNGKQPPKVPIPFSPEGSGHLPLELKSHPDLTSQGLVPTPS